MPKQVNSRQKKGVNAPNHPKMAKKKGKEKPNEDNRYNLKISPKIPDRTNKSPTVSLPIMFSKNNPPVEIISFPKEILRHNPNKQ